MYSTVSNFSTKTWMLLYVYNNWINWEVLYGLYCMYGTCFIKGHWLIGVLPSYIIFVYRYRLCVLNVYLFIHFHVQKELVWWTDRVTTHTQHLHQVSGGAHSVYPRCPQHLPEVPMCSVYPGCPQHLPEVPTAHSAYPGVCIAAIRGSHSVYPRCPQHLPEVPTSGTSYKQSGHSISLKWHQLVPRWAYHLPQVAVASCRSGDCFSLKWWHFLPKWIHFLPEVVTVYHGSGQANSRNWAGFPRNGHSISEMVT